MTIRTAVIPGKSAPVGISQNIDGSRFFVWGEALHGLTRIPPNWRVTAGIIRAANALDSVREQFGRPIIVQSWFRTEDINRAVGGVEDSRHLLGDAIDWRMPGVDQKELADYLWLNWNGGLGEYSGWFHTDLGPYGRWNG